MLTPLYDAGPRSGAPNAALVDGLVVPIGERDGVDGLFSNKKGYCCGQDVQVIATLSGPLADVGDPCPGSMHDSRAFRESGIAARWAGHYQPGGPGMTGDKGYQGTGIHTRTRSPQVGSQPTPAGPATPHSTGSGLR